MPTNIPPMTTVDPDALPPTLDVAQVAPLWGMSRWSLYDAVKAGKVPVQPLRVGNKLRFPTALVLRSLGIEPTTPTLTAPDAA